MLELTEKLITKYCLSHLRFFMHFFLKNAEKMIDIGVQRVPSNNFGVTFAILIRNGHHTSSFTLTGLMKFFFPLIVWEDIVERICDRKRFRIVFLR